MSYSPRIVQETDPEAGEQSRFAYPARIPLGILPKCDARGCTFTLDRVGSLGMVLEHRERSGQVRGKLIKDEEIADANYDIWAEIKPFYASLHDEESA